MQADHDTVVRLVKTAKGQLEGILKMIEEDRYCIDISTQLMATQSILRRANREIIEAHLEHCVKEAFQEGNEKEKIKEIMDVIEKLSR